MRCWPARGAAGVPGVVLGRAGGARLRLGDLVDLPVDDVVGTYEGALPGSLGDQ